MTDKEIIKTDLDFLIKECNRLEFENKLLKADYEASEQENVRLSKLLYNANKREDDVRGQLGEAECMLNRYDRKLQEIKEIVNQSCDKCKYGKDGIHCSIGDCDDGKLQQILQKISEVEDGQNL